MEHYYNVDITWNTDRKGVMCSPELNKDSGSCIEVATPPNFQKEYQEFGPRSIYSQLLLAVV